MVAKNINILKARKNKNDEFYTQLSDIENELKNYRDQFRNKVVYCNCDFVRNDSLSSNFFKYFFDNFKSLGLKKLVATCYQNQEVDLFSKNDLKPAIYLEYSGDGDSKTTFTLQSDGDSKTTFALQGNGDFRNQENIELLKEADIIVTNPPFSLFREYVSQLLFFKKQFLIIGNINAVTYKEFFPFIKENKVWLGYNNSGSKWFQVSVDYQSSTAELKIDQTGNKYVKMRNVVWFTNLEKPFESLILNKQYSPERYPAYDNYKAINIDKVADIPCDYNGVMGVPITFLEKYNPEQFEILGLTDFQNNNGLWGRKYVDKTLNKGGPVLKDEDGYKNVYARILIKKRVPPASS